MVPLPKVLLAIASGLILSAPFTARASPDFVPATDSFGDSDASRGSRFDPTLVRPGTSAHAISICIRAAQKDGEIHGRVMGIDVQTIDKVKSGYDVHGSVMVKQAADSRIATADFHCITQGRTVAKLTISKWQADAA